MSRTFFSSDIIEFLFLLFKNGVNYLIIGGEAVIYYGYVKDKDDLKFLQELKNRNKD